MGLGEQKGLWTYFAKSEGLLESDFYSDDDIDKIKAFGIPYGFRNKGCKVYVGEPCPAL